MSSKGEFFQYGGSDHLAADRLIHLINYIFVSATIKSFTANRIFRFSPAV